MTHWTIDDVLVFVLFVCAVWFLLAGCATMDPQTREAAEWFLLGVDVGTSILPAVLP